MRGGRARVSRRLAARGSIFEFTGAVLARRACGSKRARARPRSPGRANRRRVHAARARARPRNRGGAPRARRSWFASALRALVCGRRRFGRGFGQAPRVISPVSPRAASRRASEARGRPSPRPQSTPVLVAMYSSAPPAAAPVGRAKHARRARGRPRARPLRSQRAPAEHVAAAAARRARTARRRARRPPRAGPGARPRAPPFCMRAAIGGARSGVGGGCGARMSRASATAGGAAPERRCGRVHRTLPTPASARAALSTEPEVRRRGRRAPPRRRPPAANSLPGGVGARAPSLVAGSARPPVRRLRARAAVRPHARSPPSSTRRSLGCCAAPRADRPPASASRTGRTRATPPRRSAHHCHDPPCIAI